MEFSGRVAVVTGAASGIGRGLAVEAGRRGMRVAIADYDEVGLADTLKVLKDNSVDVAAYAVDVSDENAMQYFSSKVYDDFGEVHILFNNAGVHNSGPSWRYTAETWQRLIGVNLFGVVNGVRAFLPKMIDSKKDAVIANTASLAGLISFPYSGAYCASKHAVVGLTESIHYELIKAGAPVRMALICPGAVATAISEPSGASRSASAYIAKGDDFDVAAQTFEQNFRATIQGGMPSDEHANFVFDELQNERFWIISDESYFPMIEERIESIRARRSPKIEY